MDLTYWYALPFIYLNKYIVVGLGLFSLVFRWRNLMYVMSYGKISSLFGFSLIFWGLDRPFEWSTVYLGRCSASNSLASFVHYSFGSDLCFLVLPYCFDVFSVCFVSSVMHGIFFSAFGVILFFGGEKCIWFFSFCFDSWSHLSISFIV